MRDGQGAGTGGGLQYSCDPMYHIFCLQGELVVGEDDARIVQRHLPFEGGLAYGIDQLLEPPGLGARCDSFETRPLRLVRKTRGGRARVQAHLYCPPTCDLAVLASIPFRRFAASVGRNRPVLRARRSR